jgi:hypothetical protein
VQQNLQPVQNCLENNGSPVVGQLFLNLNFEKNSPRLTMTYSEFSTRRYLKRIKIQLTKNSVHVIKTSPFESQEFDIAYESMETRKTIETKVAYGLLVIVLFSLTTGGLFFLSGNYSVACVFAIIAAAVFVIALATRVKVITIKSFEGNIELYFSNKTKGAALAFSDKIIDSANAYLLNKFSKIDRDLPIETQLQKLDFLRGKDLINEELFEQLKNQLLGRDGKNSIGYK